MTIGMIGFLTPWMLAGLVALPVIWWLLRFTPPRPVEIAFPPIRLLLGLRSQEETPSRSPWWLTALRILIAALIIGALAGPVYNPQKETAGASRNLLIVVDNGWASASRWPERQNMLSSLLQRAESNSQAVGIVATADVGSAVSLEPMTPVKARERASSLVPMPYAGNRAEIAAALDKTLGDTKGYDVVWLSDGIDDGGADALAATLKRVAAGGEFAVVADAPGGEPLGLAGHSSAQKGLVARVTTPGGAPRVGSIAALSGRGARLAETDFALKDGERSTEVVINLPLELRNQVTRLEIDREASSGAAYLLDSRSLWQRFGIISGEAREASQPLLSPTHYIERALAPHGEVMVASTGNIERASEALLERKPSVVILANIGQLIGQTETRLTQWVEKGGMLLRFAGPRLEKGGDALLPVPLREGGRTLGGALSWRTPQKLAPFEEESPYFGLTAPADVLVNRQVLADPTAEQRPSAQIWARLDDGTPLVTASKLGEGWLVLFHITANSDWSNLPMSGLFVDMLRRTAELSNAADAPEAGAGDGGTGASKDNAINASTRTAFLTPWRTLDGFGRMGQPPVTANALPAANPDSVSPSPRNPPGFYGQPGRTRALNVMRPESELKPLDPARLGANLLSYEARKPVLLMPWLLLAAFGFFAVDALVTLAMMSGGLLQGRRAARAAAAIAIIALAAAALVAAPRPAFAQATDPAADDFALKAALTTRLAYVITGDAALDEVSQRGLQGLSRVIAARTAIEPGEPMGVNVDSDELVFFPLLYWPVRTDAEPLPDATLAKVDAYMKQGGMIVFDTKDYQMPTGFGGGIPGQSPALANLIGKLDTPRLEPVPEGHVLTKAFYLLNGFPGRWDGGTLWVEARAPEESGDGRRALKADGVSSILITSNDFAGAWARGSDNRPLYATVPGGDLQREMAYRAGINIVMYALTGNYKADQVHVPALLERLGQ
ncbi:MULTISPECIES: DUF4159 domain-containing protein [Rhodomicrobium]|uniref:DUF4159 domain-containing protein n=1 Tax=Rhodomicrobium TaxID=1068 RepID=UPI000B4B14D4|nr:MULTISPECIES: DUF4159 domain-containing protein [Rhodomicrobium]